MTDRELAHVLPALTRLRQRITGLELAAAHQADAVGLGTEVGAADTGAYWANTTRQTKAGAKRRLKLAAALDQHDTTRTAMTAGTVAEDQAAVIMKVVEELPVMQAEAETELVRLAAEHDARELGILAESGSSLWSPPTSPKSTSAGLSNARKSGLWRTAGSRSPMTGTGSPRPVHRPLAGRRDAQEGGPGVRRPQAPPALRDPGRAGSRVL